MAPEQAPSTPDLPFLDRYKWIILAIIALLIVAALAYLLLDEQAPVTVTINPPLPTATHTITASPTASPTPLPLEVYVTGAVQTPESRLSLPAGARVEDAIDAAGGVTDGADLSRVNLAAQLRDGDHIHVPTLPPTPSAEEPDAQAQEAEPEEAPTPTPNQPRLVNINTATQAELETLPRIGPALAQAIIAYREENGDFATVDDLVNVPGVGEATLAGLRDLVTVDG